MPPEIRDLLKSITPDPWRAVTGFSPEVAAVQELVWRSRSLDEKITAYRDWLRRYQPCLFGRIAAKENLLSICVLSEEDVERGDSHVQERIQAARSAWTRAAFEGSKSGFVIVFVSQRLALAVPNPAMQDLACRLTSLYLLTEIEVDKIYLEEVFLELPSHRRTTWRWTAGVNYFAANGDLRWWQDHRIPGGIALSVNSVGHMVKSAMINRGLRSIELETGAPQEGALPTKVDSLDQALEFAMRTIDMASEGVSGRATQLLTDLQNHNSVLKCPIKLPPNLAGRDCREYEGFYHTDVTLPTVYFRPEIERPASVHSQRLDFTYLWNQTADNPDYTTMGVGRRIRSVLGLRREPFRTNDPATKASRVLAKEQSIVSSPRLVEALSNDK
jgi:hypothetical protein